MKYKKFNRIIDVCLILFFMTAAAALLLHIEPAYAQNQFQQRAQQLVNGKDLQQAVVNLQNNNVNVQNAVNQLPNNANVQNAVNQVQNAVNPNNLGALFQNNKAALFAKLANVTDARYDATLLEQPPHKASHFGLGNEPLIELAVKTINFSYEDIHLIMEAFFHYAANIVGYKIKTEDGPHIREVVKKMMALELDEDRKGKYTWNGENQIFECIDSFFASRSAAYSQKPLIERRKLFNVISEGPIYKTGTPVGALPAGITVSPFNGGFPPGHPYAGYTIYACSSTRGVWYFRNAIRRNSANILQGLLKDDGQLKAAKPAGGALELPLVRTLSEMFKMLRVNGTAQDKLKIDYEEKDISLDRNFEAFKQSNPGDILKELKTAGFTGNTDAAGIYEKIWKMLSKME